MDDNKLIQIYMDRFVNRLDTWGRQWVNPYSGRYGYVCQKPDMDTKCGKYLYEPVTLDLVRRHLMGKITCAWYAIDENYCSKWLCFDSDLDDGDLDRLEIALRSWGLHLIREGRRKKRAGHLWLLFDHPIKAELLIILGDAMMRLAEVRPASKDYPHGIERFPKSATGLTQVRVLGVNLKPEACGARGWFDGVEHNILAQLEWLAAQPLNKADEVIKEAERQRPIPKVIVNPHADKKYWQEGDNRINILEHVTYRREGKQLVAQCPLCAREGHDSHKDNLQIKSDGSLFCCVFGAPNQIHTVADIVKVLLMERGQTG